jgi:hypothetical protein
MEQQALVNRRLLGLTAAAAAVVVSTAAGNCSVTTNLSTMQIP